MMYADNRVFGAHTVRIKYDDELVGVAVVCREEKWDAQG